MPFSIFGINYDIDNSAVMLTQITTAGDIVLQPLNEFLSENGYPYEVNGVEVIFDNINRMFYYDNSSTSYDDLGIKYLVTVNITN